VPGMLRRKPQRSVPVGEGARAPLRSLRVERKGRLLVSAIGAGSGATASASGPESDSEPAGLVGTRAADGQDTPSDTADEAL
jgi:hypothetical protein